MSLSALFRKAGLSVDDEEEPEKEAPPLVEQDQPGEGSALERLFKTTGVPMGEPRGRDRSATETAGQLAKLVARGAGSEGFYAGLEGAARGAANIATDIATDLPGTDLAGIDVNLERLRTRRRELMGEPSQYSTSANAEAPPYAPVADSVLDTLDRDIAALEARKKGAAAAVAKPVKEYAGAVRDTRESIRRALPVDDDVAASLPGQIAQGVGQALGTLPTFVIPGAGAGMTMGQLYQQGFDDAKRSGSDDETAHRAGSANVPAAALEYAADKLLLGKILKPLRGKVSVGQLTKDILASGAVEGATEGGQQVWQNYVAKELSRYDPDRPLDDQVMNSVLVGAIVGSAVTGGGSLASQAVSPVQIDDELAAELGRKPPQPAPAEFAGVELADTPKAFYLYRLTEDIPGHPKGSSVSGATLEKAGFTVPERPAESALPDLDLTPADNPGEIESGWKRALKGGRLFYEGAADVLRRGGFNQLSASVDRHVDLTERNLAQAWSFVRPAVDAFAGAGTAIKRKAGEEFAAYYRARENGRTDEAAEILAGASPQARALIESTGRLFTFTGAQNQRLGVQVLDREAGAWRPASNLGRDYWPRVLNEETAAVLRDPSSNPARWEQMKQELLENGNIETLAEADQFLRNSSQREQADDFFANLELARTGKLPESWHEYDPAKVLPRFVSKWSERSAQIEAFGQKVGDSGKDAFDHALEKATTPNSRAYIEATREHAYRIRRGDPALRKLLGNVTSATAGLFLGNPYSAARNLFGGAAQTVNQFGVLRSLKTLGRLWGGIADAELAGAVKADVADLLFAGDDSPAVRRAVNVALKVGGFSPAETFVRGHSFLTAKAYLRDALANARKHPGGRRVLQDRAFMRRLGFDHDALLKENLKGPLTDSFLRGAVRDAQGGYRYNQVPLFVDSPLGRFLFQFARWGTQAARFHARNTFRPAVFGEVVKVNEGGKVVEKRVRTLLPLLRSPLVAMGAGALTLAMREALLGIERADAGWDEIWRTKDEDEQRAFALALDRLTNDAIFAGTFGAISDYAGLLKDAATRSRFRNPIEPPAASILKEAGTLAYKLARQGQLTREDYERFFGSVVSAYRVGSRMAYNFADKVEADWDRAKLERADRDRLFVRRAGSRFADESGLEENPYQPGALPSVTERTPVYSRIEDALMIGDALEAQRLAEEYLAEVEPAKVKRLQKGLEASIRGRQPVRPGGSTGSELQGAFLDWAGRRLSDAEFSRIVDVQSRFLETAVNAQLMPATALQRWQALLRRAKQAGAAEAAPAAFPVPRVDDRTAPASTRPLRVGAIARPAPAFAVDGG